MLEFDPIGTIEKKALLIEAAAYLSETNGAKKFIKKKNC